MRRTPLRLADISPLTALVAVAVPLALAAGGAGCSDGEALLVLRYRSEAPLTIARLAGAVRVATTEAPFERDFGPSPVTVDGSTARTLGLVVPLRYGRRGHVRLTALDGAGRQLATDEADVSFDAGATTEVALVLRAAAPPVDAPRLIAPLSTAHVTSQRPLLRWELPAGATSPVVDLCRRRGCTDVIQIPVTVDASGTSGRPDAPIPTGAVFWRVRATTPDGPRTSRTWELFVGARSAPIDTSWGSVLDVNGDGIADLAVGAPCAPTVGATMGCGAGQIFVYLGTPTVFGAPIVLDAPDGPGSGFGEAVIDSAGDVDGDGDGDLLATAPTAAGGAGRVYVFLGGPTGPSTAPERRRVFVPDGASGTFGLSASAAGDLDGDGYGDLAVGDPGATTTALDRAGRVLLLAGGGSSLDALATVEGTAAGPQIGEAVAGGCDFDGDGRPDVATNGDGKGALFVIDGKESPPALRASRAPGAKAFADNLACVGDANGDGRADLVAGSPTFDGAMAGSGMAWFLYGADTAVLFGDPVPFADAPTEAGRGFGAAIAAADVDANGLVDVLVGESGGTLAGRLYLATLTDGLMVAPLTNASLGSTSVAFGDFDDEGHPGAVVRGAPAWTLGSEAAAPAAPGWGVPQPPPVSSFGGDFPLDNNHSRRKSTDLT